MGRTEIEGKAPGGVGLIILDMINSLDFEGAEGLLEPMRPAAEAILKLRDQADRLKVPVIYVNDNDGQWHSDRERIIDRCLEKDTPGRDLVRHIRPRPGDFFVIKPQFSGFYATNLPVLLPKLGVTRLVVTGVATDICVLFTAADAHMREYGLWVPSDAVASSRDQHHRWALEIMQKSMDADVRPTSKLDLQAWIGESGEPAVESHG